MTHFEDFTDNIFIQNDDVYTSVFTQILKGYVHKWFRFIPAASIRTMNELETNFMNKLREKRDMLY